MFEAIKDEDDLIKFFEKYFVDTINLIGRCVLFKSFFLNNNIFLYPRNYLIETFFSVKASPLLSVKVKHSFDF